MTKFLSHAEGCIFDEKFEVDFGECCMSKCAEERGFLVPTQRVL